VCGINLSRRIQMSNGFPSMTALLGMLAIAGYQNRDKLGELLSGQFGGGAGAQGQPQGSTVASDATPSVGNVLSGGLQDLVDSFTRTGQGDAAQSWVSSGPNKQIAPPQVEQAIGPDVLASLVQQTGLTREELLARLARELPSAVDKYTPEGRVPMAGAHT
jgi:uncharacterized protein YidB (DUF937 family)